MVTTVKIIFLGLIGFVPNPEGQGDVAALLINPPRARYQETECPTPRHLAMVFLLHGQCDSIYDNCYRIPGRLEKQAEKMGLGGFLDRFPGRFRKGSDLQQQGDEVNGLLWLLDREDLDITGDGDEDLDLQNPLLAFVQGSAPQSAQQSTYFSWVPSMNELTRGQGQIKDDCRQANARCPLYARFRIEGGDVGACHMFHDPSNSKGKERDVRIFDYLIPGQRTIQQRAVADAAQVVFHEEDTSVVLESRNLPGQTPPHSIKALLSPDKDGRLTLIVANLPPCPESPEDRYPQHGCHGAHSDALFQLLKNNQVRPPVRVMNEERRSVDPGPCEQELLQLPPFFECLREYPHAITACDGTRFPKPSQ